MAQKIHIYGSDGDLKLTGGGLGTGPQEFTNAVSAEVASNGKSGTWKWLRAA